MAGALGVTCQGGFVETAPSRSFLEKAKDFYTGGSFAMVASVSGIIALGVLIALCCCRGIHKDVRPKSLGWTLFIRKYFYLNTSIVIAAGVYVVVHKCVPLWTEM